ncbi:MAG: hypothetical protein J5I65_16585 [Aridibacter famidurans]|nr:hypothetical protein [Aridibacter famidurans]
MTFLADNLEALLEELPLEEIYERSELVLSVADGLKFVELCEERDWAILGLEGGITRDGGFAPNLDLIYDFSLSKYPEWSKFRQERNTKAALILNRHRFEPSLLFYITFVNGEDLEALSEKV